MYDELFAAWLFEIENNELGSLPHDFYTHLAEYLRRIQEENQLMDNQTFKTNLLEHEKTNAMVLVKDLIFMRYRKIVKMIVTKKPVPIELLASEEQQLSEGFSPLAEAYSQFADGILGGKAVAINLESPMQAEQPANKRVTLRFLKPVPSIIGSDMKSYGPFLVEDVASVPVENAKILVRQGLAKQVEL